MKVISPAALRDIAHTDLHGLRAQKRDVHELEDRLGRLAVAVDELVEQLLRLLGGAQRRDAAVDIHALLARGM